MALEPREPVTCPCGCLTSSTNPVERGWVEVFDWSVIAADDTRGPEEACTWYVNQRHLWMDAEKRLGALLSAEVSGEANERLARGEAA